MAREKLRISPEEWIKDTAGCSLESQGLWLRMMFLMHESERYGYLSWDGMAARPEIIARKCGITLDQYMALLTELQSANVTSKTPEGVIYSKRMLRDAEIRRIRVEAGRKGGFAKQMPSKSLAKAWQTPSKRLANPPKEKENPPDPLKKEKVTPRLSPTGKAEPTPPEVNSVHKLVGAWRRMLGVPPEAEKAWNAGNFARCAKSAKEILDLFGGDLEGAANCAWDIFSELKKAGCDCTLETVFRRAPEWKVKNAIKAT